jgi:hypothetical protein
MGLPDSYTVKPGSIPAYFEGMLNADAPKRFSSSFLENLDFTSSNDRPFIGILRDLGFINSDGAPTSRYFQFLDRSQSARAVAAGVREAYSDLFAVQRDANTLAIDDVRNKLRTLYKGAKKDSIIGRVASTFVALSEYGDFSQPDASNVLENKDEPPPAPPPDPPMDGVDVKKKQEPPPARPQSNSPALVLGALQYHINIVLPETREQAVYDAIFRSLRDHLGSRNG